MKVLILNGGSGTRLFPLSRKNFPKQFIKLFSDRSLFQEAVERALTLVDERDVVSVANVKFKEIIKEQLREIDVNLDNLVFEPEGRDTAPAIALGVKFLKEKLNVPDDETILVTPSDHLISPVEKFAELVKESEAISKKGYIVTFGIVPTRPETGYGYVEAGEPLEVGFKVKKFHEKPSFEKALEYLRKGNHFWNSGMFMFTPATFLEELEKHMPSLYKLYTENDFGRFLEKFREAPKLSVDYGIMERTEKAAVIPMNLNWSDVGSWDSVFELLKKDENGNVKRGSVVTVDVENSLIFSNDRTVLGVGLKDFLVVETSDVVLIGKLGEGQKVKELFKILEKNSSFKHLTECGNLVYRRWGYFTELKRGPRFKVKKLVLMPGKSISLQLHNFRSEHWVVVEGKGKVLLEGEDGILQEIFLEENQSIYVPPKRKHKLENCGEGPLKVIEVQVGNYLEEDDIIRFDY